MKYDLEKQRLQLKMERQLLDAHVEVKQIWIKLFDGSGDSGNISSRSSDLPYYPSRRYTRPFADFLPDVIKIGQDQFRPCLPSLRGIFQAVIFLIDL